MRRWTDAAVWIGEGIERDVFYFGPREARLYGSLYAAHAPSRPLGVVVCASWGFEADRTERLSHGIALTMARLGGGGMVFHYPGHGDSHGDISESTLGTLASAATTAAAEATRRRPDLSWMLSGLMIGAAVACMAQQRATTCDRLLLVQPSLSPSAYFGGLARKGRRVTLGPGRAADMAFGYPLPYRIVDAGAQADVDVRSALSTFDGHGAVVRCGWPDRDELVPERFEDVVVEGSWRFGSKDYPELQRAVAGWLDGNTIAYGRATPSQGAA